MSEQAFEYTAEELRRVEADLAAADHKLKAQQRARVAELIPGKDLTGAGQSSKFVKYCKNSNSPIAYCGAYGWMIYRETGKGGGYWQTDAQEAVKKLYLEFSREQYHAAHDNPDLYDDEKSRAAELLIKFVTKWRDSDKAIMSVLGIASATVSIEAEKFDTNPYTLNTLTGVVDLKTGELRPATAKDYNRKLCPVEYEPGADYTLWAKFLNEIAVDKDGNTDTGLIDYLQQIAGLCTIGELYEKLFIAYGSGGNGKSTLFETMGRVMGSYAVGLTSESLVEAQGRNFDLVMLDGARMALLTELSPDRTLNTARLKAMINHGKIKAERKYRDAYDFIPAYAAIMFTNDLPRVIARDAGTWSRLRILPFLASIRDTAKDSKHMSERLFDECSSGILRWMVEGAQRVIELESKLIEPDCVKAYTAKYKTAENSVSEFITDCCVIDYDVSGIAGGTSRADLYEAYQKYCAATAQDVAQKSRFKADVIALTGEPDKVERGIRYYPFIRLRDDNETKGE